MATAEYWNKKTFVIITGASKGIGRTLTEKVAELVAKGSVLLLMSRDESLLQSLRSSIEEKRADVRVYISAVDLSTTDELSLSNIITLSLESDSPSDFEHAICVHNAASLGDVTKRCTDLLQWNPCVDYLRLNIASVVVLNALFLRVFNAVQRKTVVNMSSLCGIEPFPSMALYCSGKAAREMFFKVPLLYFLFIVYQ